MIVLFALLVKSYSASIAQDNHQQLRVYNNAKNIDLRDELFFSSSHYQSASFYQGQRDLQDLVITRKQAVKLYQAFCPKFQWGKKGVCGKGKTSQSINLCGYKHLLVLAKKAVIQTSSTTFRYNASREGILYGQVTVVCKQNSNFCTLKNLYCGPVCTSSCATTNTTQSGNVTTPKWICGSKNSICGCFDTSATTKNACLPIGAPTPNCTCDTSSNSSTIIQNNCTSMCSGETWVCYDNTPVCGCEVGTCLNSKTIPPSCTCGNSTTAVTNCTACSGETWVCTGNESVCGCEAGTCLVNGTMPPSCTCTNNSTTSTNCTSCSGFEWTCEGENLKCGCGYGTCLPPGSEAPSCTCNTMVNVPWDENNASLIEMCQDGDGGGFGYRLPGETSCAPAGLVVRMHPGTNYRLTLINKSNQPTNLHTHGLHVSGDGNADDIARSASPGMCLTYHWDIPENHMGGTYWMHSHDMKYGFNQVNGGALAALIVEENSQVLDNVTDESRAGIEAWMKNELLLVTGRNTQGYMGNGKTDLVLNLIEGEWYHLRVVGFHIYGLPWQLILPTQCEYYQVAHDGVWRFSVPKSTAPTDGTFRMTPSGRMDFALRCSVVGSYTIQAGDLCCDYTTVATLSVASGTTSIATPYTSTGEAWSPKRPYYLENLLTETPDYNYLIFLTPTQINGVSFDPAVPLLNLTYGQIQQWTLRDARTHSYHGHIHAFQNVDCAGFDIGEFFDSIMPASDSPCRIRFRLADFSGKLVVHCHTILHQEAGAMAWFNVSAGGIVNPSDGSEEFNCLR